MGNLFGQPARPNNQFVSSGSSSFSGGTPGNSGSYMFTNVNGQINEQTTNGGGSGYLSHYTTSLGGAPAAATVPFGLTMLIILVGIVTLSILRQRRRDLKGARGKGTEKDLCVVL